MNAAQCMQALRARGLSLRLDGTRLRLSGDARTLADPALLQALRERKDELVALLQHGADGAEAAAGAMEPPFAPGTVAITPALRPSLRLTQAQIDRILAGVPGGAANVQDLYPLTPLQEGLLFHHRLQARGEGEGDAYVMPTLLRLDSRERLEAFLQALDAAVARHDVLRTALRWEGLEQPLQLVQRQAKLELEYVPVAPGADALACLLERADPQRVRLDLQRAPMLRAFAAPQADGRWLLQLLHHHAILDHTASELLVQEIGVVLQGQGAALPPAVPYRRFVEQARRGASAAEHEAYFRQRLGDVDHTTAPFELSDVRGDGRAARQAHAELPPELAQRLRTQARRRGASPASVFHLAWALVLAACTGRDDVVFGTVLFGRVHAGADAGRALGLFLNTLPLRLRLDRQDAESALRQVHAELAGLLRHEHAPLSLAQRCSALPGQAPLFASLLNYRYSAPAQTPSALPGVELLQAHDRTNYPFVLHVDDYGEGFGLTAEIDRSVEAGRVLAMATQTVTALVDTLEHAPGRSLHRLERLPPDERGRVVHGFNATAGDLPQAPLHRLVEQRVRACPDAIAVEFEGQRLSYAELNARANRLARRLREAGVGPDARVGVHLQRGLWLPIALLAALKAGGAYLPLDPDLPAQRLAEMIAQAAPTVVLTQTPGALASGLALCLDEALFAAHAHGDAEDLATPGLCPDHLAYVMYTSGSTGRPKAVMNTHRGIANRLLGMQRDYTLGADDAVLQKTPFGFDVSVWEFFWPWIVGARLVLARPDGHRDPGYLGRLIAETGVSVLHFVPSMLQAFLARADAVAGCAGVRQVLCSGEALPADTVRRLHECLPRVRLHNLYGPTEAAVDVSAWHCEADPGRAVPIGRPVANTRLYVLDARLRPAPVGVAGEIYIGGVQLARGYLGRPGLSAERFVADPFAHGQRLYRTGDLGRWREDGAIEYLGRNDFQVKLRGQRLELGEIEAAVRALDGVADAAALARPGPDGAPALVAYVVLRPGAPELAELRARLGQRLPDYMVPAAWVALEALPLNANGKLDRNALPEPDRQALARPYAPPQGEVETALAEDWRQVLGVARVGRHDRFFDLGGNSLLAMGLLERLRQRGWSIDVRAVFAQAELCAMAAAVLTAPDAARPAVPDNAIPDRFAEPADEPDTEEFRL